MNPLDSITGGKAVLEYLDGEFAIIEHGGYVLCAITGKRIALESLRYWSVDRQEAYLNAHIAVRAMYPEAATGAGKALPENA